MRARCIVGHDKWLLMKNEKIKISGRNNTLFTLLFVGTRILNLY